MEKDRRETKGLDRFLNKKVVILDQSCLIQQAARAMGDNGIGCIIVSGTRGQIVGLVTDRDLTCYPLAFNISPQEPLSQIMTTEPLFVHDSDGLDDVIGLMVENGIRRVPVVSGHEKCVGIVTLDDLIVARAVTIDEVIKIVTTQGRKNPLVQGRHTTVNEERQEARAEQTLHRFYNVLAEEMGITGAEVQKAVWIVFGSMVRGVQKDLARKITAQLPKQLRYELMNLPPGPDKTVTVKTIDAQIRAHLPGSGKHPQHLVHTLFTVLDKHLGCGEVRHLRGQLPIKLRRLIPAFSQRETAKGGSKVIDLRAPFP